MPSAGPQKTTSGTRTRPGRLMVVDDEGAIGDEVSASLADHEVVVVECGEDALGILAAGQRFDLILCEVMMPGMNGVDLLERLRDAYPMQAERLVFMTDRIVSPIVQHLLEGASNLCLERPFDKDGLRALIERRIQTPVKAQIA